MNGASLLERTHAQATGAQAAVWWKDKRIIAMIGLVIPAATLVQGTLQKDRELALQRERNVQELTLQGQQDLQQLRIAYMNVLVEAGVEGLDTVAEFSAATETNQVIRAWAQAALGSARESIAEIRRELDEQAQQADDAEDKALALEHELARVRERLAADRTAHEHEIQEVNGALTDARRQAAVARDRIAQKQGQLAGRQASGVLVPPKARVPNVNSRTLASAAH